MEKRNRIDSDVDRYYEMLDKLPTPIADRLREKIKKDTEQFNNYVADVTPSTDPKFWAKPSCKRCHGTGIMGKLVKTGETLVCDCATKQYGIWLANTRRIYIEKRSNITEEH